MNPQHTDGSSSRDPRRWIRSAAALIFTITLVAQKGYTAEGNDGPVETARATLENWVETRRIISREKRDWAFGKEIVEERAQVLQRELDALRARTDEAKSSMRDADRKRRELVADKERLEQQSDALEGSVAALEAGTKQLLGRLPVPIQDRVKPLSQGLPENPDDAKLSLSRRFQNIVGILNEINKFNSAITVTSELQKLPDGSTSEVTVVYVGIGQSYFVTPNRTAAAVGTEGAGGWIWTPESAAVEEIARVIAILKNEQVAQYVRLPVRLQ